MEEKGIIQGYQANLDYHALGVEFYKAFLYFENFPQPVQKRLYELCRRHPNVVNFLKVVAPWSIELEIMTENYAHYREIINHLRHEFADSLVNVESTNLAEDYIYPARATIFKFNETKGD
jgi:DNA-binding Lrp family transcriptional regulator